MQTENGKSEQTLPSCDHSASNRLIQAYLDKKNLSDDFGGCASAKMQDKAVEVKAEYHASNLSPELCEAITRGVRDVNSNLSAFSREEYNVHVSTYAIEKLASAVRSFNRLLDQIAEELDTSDE